jgi:mRNA-degrading endonuclease RelE of RelBE toxin-antitoxin system
MVDRIDKALSKMSAKERAQILSILESIERGDVASLDLKKLKGFVDTFRVRKGRYRIIFYMKDNKDIRIIDVERRTDTTYRDL